MTIGEKIKYCRKQIGITQDKLAELTGIHPVSIRLETVGDLMGVLMVLCNSGILQISGERGDDNLLKDNTVSIHLNLVLSSYLEIGYNSRGKAHTLALQDALLNIRSYKVFNDLLKWEKIYQSVLESAGDNPNEATQVAIDEIAETKEKVELELQRSQLQLLSQ